MPLFARNKELAVQGFILKLVNNNCAEMERFIEGPRLEGRVSLVLVALVVPLEKGKAVVDQAFSAVTKEFSSSGVSLVLDEPLGVDEAAIGFQWEGEMTWLHGKAKHLSPLGGGFYQLGFRLTDIMRLSDHPTLKPLRV